MLQAFAQIPVQGFYNNKRSWHYIVHQYKKGAIMHVIETFCVNKQDN